MRSEFLQRFDLWWLAPLGFENAYELAVPEALAESRGLRTISDLARIAPELTAGLGYEFIDRDDGLPGLRRAYGLEFGKVVGVQQTLKYQAARAGDIAAFGRLIFESHKSSSALFENSCPELDKLVKIASQHPAVLGAKLSGGKQWPKKQVASGDKPGLVVIDILKTTKWKTGVGPLSIMLYTHGDGSKAEYGYVKFTDTLSAEEQAAVKAEAAAAPGKSAPKHAGLTALAARRGMKPMGIDPENYFLCKLRTRY